MVCEFIESFLEGDKESLERHQEVKLLLIPVLVSKQIPFPIIPHPIIGILRTLLQARDYERRFIGSFFTTHVYAYKMPLKQLEPLIEDSLHVYKELYERCSIDDLAVLIAETHMHLGMLSNRRRESSNRFSEALKILKSLEAREEGYYRSVGFLYLHRGKKALRFGMVKVALENSKKALGYFKRARYKKLIREAYDSLLRSSYLLELDEAKEYASLLAQSVPREPNALVYLAITYLFTGFEELYERIEDDLRDLPPITPAPITLAKIYASVAEDREESLKRLASFTRLPDPLISSLAFIIAGRIDVSVERARNSFLKALNNSIRAKLYDIAKLSILEAKKKGVDKNTLEKMLHILSEEIKRNL